MNPEAALEAEGCQTPCLQWESVLALCVGTGFKCALPEEPGAVIPHAGICEGVPRNRCPYLYLQPIKSMPAGDASRSWFPQMIDVLKKKWTRSLSWEECAQLAREMTELRAKIRKVKGISSPQMFCKSCGEIHGMDPLSIGIRSMLFALRKAEVLDGDHFVRLDNEWKKHQRLHRLDYLGDPKMQNKSPLADRHHPA